MTYCTVFDSAYLSRALLCWKSLVRAEPNAHLYFFCLDETSADALERESLKNCTIVHPTHFECDELLALKTRRSKGEYAWTVKPYAITYVFENFAVSECSYVDADLYFRSSPQKFIDQYHDKSVILTPHNYARPHDTSDKNGIYSAQFINFRNDENGKKLLLWWKQKCFDWCYARHEPDRFGDQKYLEHIAIQSGAVVAEDAGFIGPWNVARYEFDVGGLEVSVSDKYSPAFGPVIFFHFHGFKIINARTIDLGGYPIADDVYRCFYFEYAEELRSTNDRLWADYRIRAADYFRSTTTIMGLARAVRNWLIGRYRLFL